MKKTLFIALALFFLMGFSNSVKAQILDVYQYFNPTADRHFYTTNFNELGNGSLGFTYYGSMGKLQAQGDPNVTTGIYSRAVYRFYNTATYSHYYTMRGNIYPSGYHLESIMGYTPSIVFLNPIPVYEYYNSVQHDYYYTTIQSAGSDYVLNGIAFYVSN